MLNLNDVYYFVQVVDKRGFSAASKALNVAKSSLSRRVLELEAQLGARLIQRTSRHFTVTDVGQEFYQYGQAMLAEAEAAEQSVKRRVAEPQGAVRLTCSVAVAQFLVADLLPQFAKQFPKVDIVELATNRYVDLIDEGFDLALRAHSRALPDSSLIQRPISATPWGLFASQSYLVKYGTPLSPPDLLQHTGLLLKHIASQSYWRLRQGQLGEATVPFQPRLCSDDIPTLKTAAEASLGIVALPIYLCRAEVLRGTLTRVLPTWTAGDAVITLLAPSRRGLLPSVRALSTFLTTELQPIIGRREPSA